MFQYNTPIEEYKVKNKTVYVKRDDLFGQEPAPHLAKLRGIKKYVDKMDEHGVTHLGDLDTRVSKSGWGLACACQNTGITPVVFYPKLKHQTELPPIQQKAQDLGATVIPIQAMRTSAVYGIAKKKMKEIGGEMLPMGLTLQETVEEVANVIKDTPEDLLTGTIIVSTGTGTICSGIVSGLIKRNIKPNAVYGVSCGMSNLKQAKVMQKKISQYFSLDDKPVNAKLPSYLQLIIPSLDYYDISEIETPFPCSPYYDKKAWFFLWHFIKGMKEPILFWNIGD